MSLLSELAGKAPRTLSLHESVAAAVERICGSRRGAMLLAPGYGVDDVSTLFHSFPQIDAWAAHLERAIQRYEPRLRDVSVAPLVTEGADLTLRAEIRGVLVVEGRPSPARFTATLDPACRLSVR